MATVYTCRLAGDAVLISTSHTSLTIESLGKRLAGKRAVAKPERLLDLRIVSIAVY